MFSENQNKTPCLLRLLLFLFWLGSNGGEFNSDGGSLSLQVCPSHSVSLKATVDVAKGDFQPPCPPRRRRKQRDPMRNTATTPTSVRKFHWTVPYQIIVQPSKYCWLCVTLRARADGCFHVLVGSSLLFPAYQGDDCLMAMLSDEQQMQLAQPPCLSQQSPPGTLLGISCWALTVPKGLMGRRELKHLNPFAPQCQKDLKKTGQKESQMSPEQWHLCPDAVEEVSVDAVAVPSLCYFHLLRWWWWWTLPTKHHLTLNEIPDHC